MEWGNSPDLFEIAREVASVAGPYGRHYLIHVQRGGLQQFPGFEQSS